MRIVSSLFGMLLTLALGVSFVPSQGYSPETAVKKMRPAEGFTVKGGQANHLCVNPWLSSSTIADEHGSFSICNIRIPPV